MVKDKQLFQKCHDRTAVSKRSPINWNSQVWHWSVSLTECLVFSCDSPEKATVRWHSTSFTTCRHSFMSMSWSSSTFSREIFSSGADTPYCEWYSNISLHVCTNTLQTLHIKLYITWSRTTEYPRIYREKACIEPGEEQNPWEFTLKFVFDECLYLLRGNIFLILWTLPLATSLS